MCLIAEPFRFLEFRKERERVTRLRQRQEICAWVEGRQTRMSNFSRLNQRWFTRTYGHLNCSASLTLRTFIATPMCRLRAMVTSRPRPPSGALAHQRF